MKKPSAHYVDNVAFLAALKLYRTSVLQYRAADRDDHPPIPDFIGECFLKIATHLAFKPNFAGYTYRDDMCSDGVENCLIYAHNFDPAKSNNPFSYFTTIIYYAFLRRIQREKKHTYIKYKLMEKAAIDTLTDSGRLPVDTTMLTFDNVQEFITRYDDYSTKRRERRHTTARVTKKARKPKKVAHDVSIEEAIILAAEEARCGKATA